MPLQAKRRKDLSASSCSCIPTTRRGAAKLASLDAHELRCLCGARKRGVGAMRGLPRAPRGGLWRGDARAASLGFFTGVCPFDSRTKFAFGLDMRILYPTLFKDLFEMVIVSQKSTPEGTPRILRGLFDLLLLLLLLQSAEAPRPPSATLLSGRYGHAPAHKDQR